MLSNLFSSSSRSNLMWLKCNNLQASDTVQGKYLLMNNSLIVLSTPLFKAEAIKG